MPRKTVVLLPEFGAFLATLREGFRWKQSQAANIAGRRGIRVSYQALRGLESGVTQSPEPELLRSLAQLYRVPYEELVRRFVEERYGVSMAPADWKQISEERLGDDRFVLENDEPELIDAWRLSNPEGQHAALAVLKVSKKTKGSGKTEQRRSAPRSR